jgi:hypothetical protein
VSLTETLAEVATVTALATAGTIIALVYGIVTAVLYRRASRDEDWRDTD